MGNCWPTPIDDSIHRPSSPGSGNVAVPLAGEIITPNLKVFTFAELKSATRNFHLDTVVGDGGFGMVFKGRVEEKTFKPSKPGFGIAVAVKKLNADNVQGLEEWQFEVKFLGKFSHPNLVKLLGYCWEEKQFLLVYEFMHKGSLESHLFRTKRGADTLSWEKRIKIALGAAQGLTFLHTTEKQVIYRDFKAANILLDGDYNAKLAGFSLAKLGPSTGYSPVRMRAIGTYGYVAPEYIRAGHLSMKSDIYSFGVVLLELLSGLRVIDRNRPNRMCNLVDWAKPFLPNKRKLRKIMDSRLEGQFPTKAAIQTAQLILRCLESEPERRPSMREVWETLQQISALEMKPKESKVEAKK